MVPFPTLSKPPSIPGWPFPLLFPQVWIFEAVNIMVVLKFGYYIAARSPLNSHTNTGAYAYSPHFKNVMLDLAYVIFLFVAG